MAASPLPQHPLLTFDSPPPDRDLPHRFEQGPRLGRRRPGQHQRWHLPLSQQACRRGRRQGWQVLLSLASQLPGSLSVHLFYACLPACLPFRPRRSGLIASFGEVLGLARVRHDIMASHICPGILSLGEMGGLCIEERPKEHTSLFPCLPMGAEYNLDLPFVPHPPIALRHASAYPPGA